MDAGNSHEPFAHNESAKQTTDKNPSADHALKSAENSRDEASPPLGATRQGGSKRVLFVRLLIAALVIAALGYGYELYAQHNALYPSTNDAQVGAHVVNMAPQVTGTVAKVDVASFTMIKKGQILVSLDPAPFLAAVDQAKAQLALAHQQVEVASQAVDAAQSNLDAQRAILSNAQQAWDRVKQLADQGTLPQSTADAQRSTLTQAQAGVQAAIAQLNKAKAALGATGEKNPTISAAQAGLKQAELNLSYTSIAAPVTGIVGDVSVRPGSLAGAGTQIMQIVDTSQWWVDANFKETDLERIRDGQPATIALDMLPGVTFKGKVKALSPASGAAFSLFPPNNATGNWVKVTQRFPVRVSFDPGQYASRVRIGGSATVTLDTTGLNP